MSRATGGARTRIEGLSLPLYQRLARLPRALPFVAMLALLVGGLLVAGPLGAVMILVGVLFLGWLLFLGWPHLAPAERLMRLSIIVLGVGLAVVQIPRH